MIVDCENFKVSDIIARLRNDLIHTQWFRGSQTGSAAPVQSQLRDNNYIPHLPSEVCVCESSQQDPN